MDMMVHGLPAKLGEGVGPDSSIYSRLFTLIYFLIIKVVNRVNPSPSETELSVWLPGLGCSLAHHGEKTSW